MHCATRCRRARHTRAGGAASLPHARSDALAYALRSDPHACALRLRSRSSCARPSGSSARSCSRCSSTSASTVRRPLQPRSGPRRSAACTCRLRKCRHPTSRCRGLHRPLPKMERRDTAPRATRPSKRTLGTCCTPTDCARASAAPAARTAMRPTSSMAGAAGRRRSTVRSPRRCRPVGRSGGHPLLPSGSCTPPTTRERMSGWPSRAGLWPS